MAFDIPRDGQAQFLWAIPIGKSEKFHLPSKINYLLNFLLCASGRNLHFSMPEDFSLHFPVAAGPKVGERTDHGGFYNQHCLIKLIHCSQTCK